MAQFLRPDSNVTQTNITGGFADIDEATFDDADRAYTPVNTTGQLEVGVSNPGGTPGAGTTTVRYRLVKVNNVPADETGGNTQLGTVSVYQGTTLISADAERTLDGTPTAYSWTPDMSGVTDWNDIRIRFDFPASGGGPTGNRRGGATTWAEIETPDADVPVVYNQSIPVTSTFTPAFARSILFNVLIAISSTFTLIFNLTKGFAVLIATTSTFTADLTRLALRNITIAITSAFAVSYHKLVNKYLAFTSIFNASVSKLMAKLIDVASTFTLVFNASKSFAVAIAIPVTMALTFTRTALFPFTIAVSSTFTTTYQKLIAKSIAVTSTFDLTYVKTVSKFISVASTFQSSVIAPTVSKFIAVSSTFTAGVNSTLNMARSIQVTMSSVVAFVAQFIPFIPGGSGTGMRRKFREIKRKKLK